jgi:hypothetical protein
MAQHDYVIANGTGAAVRSDLNSALAAIVSQNSGATAPSTTYAYQWWADTTTGLLKLRNAANNAWITLFQLDGEWSTLAVENGSASAPSIYFKDSGTDTGIYSPGTDQVAISTGGTGRLFVDSSGRVGLGTSAPYTTADIRGNIRVQAAENGDNILAFGQETYALTGSPGGVRGNSYIVGTSSNGAGYPGYLSFYTTTSGVVHERVRIDSQGRLGIGVTPSAQLDVKATSGTLFRAEYTGVAQLNIGNGGNSINYYDGDTQIFRSGGGTERGRWDSSGRFLVGTSTARSFSFWDDLSNQFEGTTYKGGGLSLYTNANEIYGGVVALGHSRGTTIGSNTVVQNNDYLGTIVFYGSDGSNEIRGAEISAFVDGTPGANDMPGRLVFSVSRDGASSPTEALRIANTGRMTSASDQNIGQLIVDNTNGSYTSTLVTFDSSTAAGSGWFFLACQSGNGADNEILLRGDGNGLADGSWVGGGADYAEYFEWSDGNPDEDDRRGISVVLDDEKIRPAVDGEDPIGVISGNPSVVGDSAWNKWSGKYLRDDYGTYILEDYEVVNDEGETIIQQRRKLNPAYDPDQEYTSREERPEWDCVGLMGKLRIRKGQPTGSRWIKMRDISDSVEEWLVR